MPLRKCILSVLCASATFLVLRGELLAASPERTPIDEYVAKDDAAYGWSIRDMVAGEGYTLFVLHLKSQTWRAASEVDRPVWEHTLLVVKPKEVVTDIGFLRIGGGENGKPREQAAADNLVRFATATGSVTAEVMHVPNQPLVLFNDGEKREEDNLVALSQRKFMDTGDPMWLVRNAMVKSAVRAMDAVQELLASEQGGKVSVQKFVVSGGSKRGWTTWLTGAMDQRVVAIIPVVIDALNQQKTRPHRFASYGFWSPSLKDYLRHGLLERMRSPEMEKLVAIEDPYSYRERLTLPKFLVNATGDEFFPPDSSQFYYDDLVGEKHLRYVPNVKHDLKGSDARDSILAFYRAILTNQPRPRYSWKLEDDGTFRVQCTDKPVEVKLWQATNPKARDFRAQVVGRIYASSPLADQGDGVYIGRVEAPKAGFTAYFVEMTFDSGHPEPFKFTTRVNILPDVLPFADQDPATGELGPELPKEIPEVAK